jgi:pentapeptide MXKDX repeat protein
MLRKATLIVIGALVLVACGAGDDTNTSVTVAPGADTTAPMDDEPMSDDSMSDDSMSDDSMSDDSMSDDSMTDDSMTDDSMTDDTEGG